MTLFVPLFITYFHHNSIFNPKRFTFSLHFSSHIFVNCFWSLCCKYLSNIYVFFFVTTWIDPIVANMVLIYMYINIYWMVNAQYVIFSICVFGSLLCIFWTFVDISWFYDFANVFDSNVAIFKYFSIQKNLILQKSSNVTNTLFIQSHLENSRCCIRKTIFRFYRF